MTDFASLEAEQADMFRWIRRNLTDEQFTALTGKKPSDGTKAIDIDLFLRDAYVSDSAARAAKAMTERSNIRSGVLPPDLGRALILYTRIVGEAATFEEGLGGATYADMDLKVRDAFMDLCSEMAKLR